MRSNFNEAKYSSRDGGMHVGENSISMDLYFKDIRKLKPLKSDEQIILAIKARGGDKEAEKKLVESNQRFIVSIAKDYRGLGLDIEDLISEGNIGLLKAIDKYDEGRGVKFLSYAVWWIRQSMMQSIYETADTVRLPINKINAINKLTKVKESLYQKYNREASYDELSENSDFKRDDIYAIYDGSTSLSIDENMSDDSDFSLMDIISSGDYSDMEAKMNQDSLIDEIGRLFSNLSDREGDIMNMYFGLNGCDSMTLKEIGENLSLTNERVRQIKESAIKKLRSHSKITKLKEFFKFED